MINCSFPSARFSRHGNDGYKITNFDINKQRVYKHEINYGMQTMGGGGALRKTNTTEKERKKWRKRIKKENRRRELGMQSE